MAGWMKMPLGTEVGLGPGDFVFDGDPATRRKRAHSPYQIFGPCLLWPNGWMVEVVTWYGSRPQRRPHCIRCGPSCLLTGTAAPLFSPMSVVATVAHLGYCWALVSSSYTARMGVHKRQIKLGYLEHKADVTWDAFQCQKLAPVDQHL